MKRRTIDTADHHTVMPLDGVNIQDPALMQQKTTQQAVVGKLYQDGHLRNY